MAGGDENEMGVSPTVKYDRHLRCLRRQIEKAIVSARTILEKNLTPILCSRLESVEPELANLRAEYAAAVKAILELVPDCEFDTKCDALTDEQNRIVDHCRMVVAECRAATLKFQGKKPRESLGAVFNSTEAHSFESNVANSYPKIRIPKFDGDYRQFMRFKGIFTNLVHDEASISNVRKLYYLQDALSGEAARLIEDLPMSDRSYEEAWSRIKNRYDNQRALVMIYFRELLDIKKIKHPGELRSLVDTVTNALNNLRLCGLPAENWGDLIAYMVYRCLDDKTKEDFDNTQVDNTKFFNWKTLSTFIQGRAYTAETRYLAETEMPKFDSNSSSATNTKTERPKPVKKAAFATTQEGCVACSENHFLINCPVFSTKTPKQRFELVSQNNMCANCFSKTHAAKKCTKENSCKLCARRHHTLLHFPESSTSASGPADSPKLPAKNQNAANSSALSELDNEPVVANLANICAMATAAQKTVILPSAVVHVCCNGHILTARLLLDSCSQVTLISEDFVRKFKLPSIQSSEGAFVKGVSPGILDLSSSCTLTLVSRFEQFQLPIEAVVAPQSSLAYEVHGVELPKSFKGARIGLPLADPAFLNSPVSTPLVDILVGAEYYEKCILNETKEINSLTLRDSHFGWVVTGPIISENRPFCAAITQKPPLHALTVLSLEAQLRRYLEVEDVSPAEETLTDEKLQCVQHFDATHSRGVDGKFVVRLPKRTPAVPLADNFVIARQIFYRSEKIRPLKLQPDYVEFLREYEQLGHMTHLQPAEIPKPAYYIPHRAVLRPSSTTTRVRVVYNASAKTASGYSLNDALMVGPSIQPDIVDILLQFRQHIYAFAADIAKMYRCIWVHEEDRHLQCILWRVNAQSPLQIFQLNTVTYGTAPASFLATKCLEVLSKTAENPKVASAIAGHFYMDDLLSGANSLEECKTLQHNIHNILAGAGFILRKYQSNSSDLLSTIDETLVQGSSTVDFDGNNTTSVLGIYWNPNSDSFHLKIADTPAGASPITRRNLLSGISKTFDPLGFAAPFTIRGKIFMQRVWKEKGTWDQPVSEALAVDFAAYWRELSQLEKFAIPRGYYLSAKVVSQRLIGFGDASELACCAVIYLRATYEDGSTSVTLVCAKTKVAPMKLMSVPRLELQAAWLLTELIQRVSTALEINPENISTFSDAKVVLSWLAKPPSMWKTFVRNRTAKILNHLPFPHWFYVPTTSNPADLATRGLPVGKFLQSTLWLHGPEFLKSDFTPTKEYDDTEVQERRKAKVVLHFNLLDHSLLGVTKFSSYNRLIRSFAFALRFISHCRRKIRTSCVKLQPYLLTADELSSAETAMVLVTQRHHFADVYLRMSKGNALKKKDPLRSLQPFLDDHHLLRVGGRLRNATLPYEQKHPIILPANCHLVLLLSRELHHRFYHVQKSFLLAHIRRKFWIHGNLSQVVKKCIRECTTCIRYNTQPMNQLMGDLPSERVTISRPFSKVGVDFAGPFTVKCVGHRSTIRFKAYVAVFVCLSTHAVHLEVVSQLSTDHFLLCLSRFIARRGRPHLIWSDNGTNFVGAAGYLDLSASKIADFSTGEKIHWRFNPPRAPHRGGIWESAVKSMKKHLVRVTNGQTFTFEEMATVVARIESILNSRPLFQKADAGQNSLILTPAHFLIGDSLLADPIPSESNMRLAKRYEIVSRIVSSFWKVWSKDHLAQLQVRAKWQTATPNLVTGTLVILREDNTQPQCWKYGRIMAVHPDAEGRVRTAQILVDGQLRCRATSSLIPLPTTDALNN